MKVDSDDGRFYTIKFFGTNTFLTQAEFKFDVFNRFLKYLGEKEYDDSSGNNGASVPNFPYSPLQNPCHKLCHFVLPSNPSIPCLPPPCHPFQKF